MYSFSCDQICLNVKCKELDCGSCPGLKILELLSMACKESFSGRIFFSPVCFIDSADSLISVSTVGVL